MLIGHLGQTIVDCGVCCERVKLFVVVLGLQLSHDHVRIFDTDFSQEVGEVRDVVLLLIDLSKIVRVGVGV